MIVPNWETAPVNVYGELRKLVPLDVLLASGGMQSKDKHARDFEDYKEWANRLGSAVVGMAKTFIDGETGLSDTPFRRSLVEAAVRDVMEAAYRQADE